MFQVAHERGEGRGFLLGKMHNAFVEVARPIPIFTPRLNRAKRIFTADYNEAVARGWESKSVEAQQEEAAQTSTLGKPRLTREQAARLREQESLRLSLKSVAAQLGLNPSPRRREMLEQAQAELERKITELSPAPS